jgi:hypothetical protein
MQPIDRQHFIDKVRSSIPRNLTKKRTPKVIDLDVGPDAKSAAASLPARDPNHKAVKSAADATCVFDPCLSPQFYTKGAVPAVIVGDVLPLSSPHSSRHDDNDRTSTSKAVKTVGILRIDHGSRKAASNERWHAFANLFQEQNGHR